MFNHSGVGRVVLLAALIGSPMMGQSSPQSDNTKVNKRDRNAGEPTADQGKNNKSDRETMRAIRKAVVDDKSLSTYAHNIKIISQGGKVTVKGPVHSEDEKKSVLAKATAVAGEGNVTDQITVEGNK